MAKWKWFEILRNAGSRIVLHSPEGRMFSLQEYIGGMWSCADDTACEDIFRQIIMADKRAGALQELRQFIVDGLKSGHITFPVPLDPPSMALRRIDAALNGLPEPQNQPEPEDKRLHAMRNLLQEFVNNWEGTQPYMIPGKAAVQQGLSIDKARALLSKMQEKKPQFPPNERHSEGSLK